MLDIAMYRKMMINLSNDEENGGRSLKEALELGIGIMQYKWAFV